MDYRENEMVNFKITVIVPVYNAKDYLKRCIDSILMQTFQDFELILVDDGCTDGSGEICDQYSIVDSRVKVIHQKNQGQSAARNHAVEQARGQWINFVDSDDCVHPQLLEKLYSAVSNGNAQVSMCSALEADYISDDFFSRRKDVFFLYNINEESMLKLYNEGGHRCWVVWGKLIHKDIVTKIPFEEGRIYEDNAVVCRWLYEARIVADVREQLYFYFINPHGTTKKRFNLKKLDYLWALEEMVRFYKDVHFSRLRKKFCYIFMDTAADFRIKVIKELHRKDVAKKITRYMWKMYFQNWHTIGIIKENRMKIYEALFPSIIRIFWLLNECVQTYKKDCFDYLKKSKDI